MRRGQDPRSAAQKLLAVLGAFSWDDAEGLTLTQISARAGLPMSTTFRLVRDWVSWGGLNEGQDRRYVVGTRVWEIGALNPMVEAIRSTAAPFLERIVATTGLTAQMAILDGGDALTIEKKEARDDPGGPNRVGARTALHASGVGLALFAYAGPVFIERRLAGGLERFTSRTVTDPEAVRRRLADIRLTGTAFSDREYGPDVISVAAPIWDPSSRVVAAVAVVAPADRPGNERLVPLIRAAGRGISNRIGAGRDEGAPDPQADGEGATLRRM